MFRDAAIEQQKVRMDEVIQLAILTKQKREELLRFANHRGFENVVKLRVEPPVGHGEINLPQFEPLADKVLDKRFRFAGGQHSFHLTSKYSWLVQRTIVCKYSEWFVRQ